LREWLFGHFNEVARLCGFQNYDAPVLEMQELYKRKAGEEITQQMYAFNDKSEPPREVTLRPEMTPSLARMVLARAHSHNLPLKWSSIPQCWRYDPPLLVALAGGVTPLCAVALRGSTGVNALLLESSW
jgi:histidyl-tRNA synthetase